MIRPRTDDRSTGLLFLMALAGLAGLLLGPQAPAAAQTGAPPQALPGAWCGVTDDGGSLRLSITDDGRFVDLVEMSDTKGGSFSSEESGCATERAQLADGRFIFRCKGTSTDDRSPGGSNRCTKAPCRGGGGAAASTQASLIRGFLLGPESMRGNYSAYATRTINSVRGTTTSTKRIVGNYIAWPVSAAPCP